MTNTNLSFTISSKTQLNKKFIKLTISYKNHFKQEMDIKKEKKTFGKIFAIELQLFPEAAPSQLQEKKKSPTPYLKLSPFRMKKFPTSHQHMNKVPHGVNLYLLLLTSCHNK